MDAVKQQKVEAIIDTFPDGKKYLTFFIKRGMSITVGLN